MIFISFERRGPGSYTIHNLLTRLQQCCRRLW